MSFLLDINTEHFFKHLWFISFLERDCSSHSSVLFFTIYSDCFNIQNAMACVTKIFISFTLVLHDCLSICAGDRGNPGWCSQGWSVPPDSCSKCSGWFVLCPLKPGWACAPTYIHSRPERVVLIASSSACGKCREACSTLMYHKYHNNAVLAAEVI